MKKIYRFKITYQLGDYSIEHSLSPWNYGELPEVKKFEHSPAILREDNTTGFWIENGFFGRKYIFVSGSTYNERLTDDTKASTTLTPVEVYSYTVAELITHLPAEEFIEWCKDHGMIEIKI